MSRGKDLHAMVADVERRLDEEVSPGGSPYDEPPAEPMFPRPRMSLPRVSGVGPGPREIEKEWTVLETGAEMLYRASTAVEREDAWHRHASAMRCLQEWTRGRQPVPHPGFSVAEVATAVAQRMQQARVVGPTALEIAREVVALIEERLPPTLNPHDMADRIADLVVQSQSPAYSPIHDAGALAGAILDRLRDHMIWELRQPIRATSAPPRNDTATNVPSTSREELATSAPSTSRDEPLSEGMNEDESQTEDEEHTTERRCIACGKTRGHNSRLWCEACRTFLRRSKKAAADGHPVVCKDTRHRQNPDITACRGCRMTHLQALEIAANRSEGSCATEDIGFRRGGECDPRVPPTARRTARLAQTAKAEIPKGRDDIAADDDLCAQDPLAGPIVPISVESGSGGTTCSFIKQEKSVEDDFRPENNPIKAYNIADMEIVLENEIKPELEEVVPIDLEEDDLLYFKSLAPDLKMLSPELKNVFRIKVKNMLKELAGPTPL